MTQGPKHDGGSRPRLAVMYEVGAFSPFEIRDAAQDLCDLVWVTGWSSPLDRTLTRLLPRLGTVLDVEGLGRDDVITALREAGVDGIVVFSDVGQEPAAEIAAALGLAFHSPHTALLLRDKFEQRLALREGGLPVPAVIAVCRESVGDREAAEDLEMTWPAVLKPRRGSGGRETFLVRSPEELTAVLDDASEEERFILEEYLADRADRIGSGVAAMVSVELVVVDGVAQHIAVSGRFPIVPPLRENGGFLPSHLDAEESAEVIEVAKRAAAALGVTRGVLHIEIKQTPVGPRIIEVNGRVGGVVPTLLAQIGGPPLLTWALRLALGLDIPAFAPIAADSRVAFYYAWLPPVGEYVVREVESFDAVRAIPQVDHAWLNREPGDRVSSREGGMFGHLAAAYGAVDSHEELWPLADELQRVPSFTLDASPAQLPA
ncbi:MAG TPA: ATP-grasp domain-containing protein [Solirubrobacteraceae bacterium]|nr:ATP-grasp domain-containing protein [Solirubrobacteraceae bacterium]